MTPVEIDAALKEQWKYLSAIAKRFTRYGPELEDLRQEAAMAAVAALRMWSPGGGSSIRSWIYRPVWHRLWLYVQRSRGTGMRPMPRGGAEVRARVPLKSLDAPVSDDRTLYDMLGFCDPELDQIRERRLLAAMDVLTPFERRVLTLRLAGMTYAEIGRSEKRSRERIRQIETAAIAKVKKRLDT